MTTANIGIVDRETTIASLTTALKALANESRVALISSLTNGEKSVGELAQELGVGLTTASAHLQVLRRAGFVETRREGVTIYYHLVREEMVRMHSWSTELGMGWNPMPQAYGSDYLE